MSDMPATRTIAVYPVGLLREARMLWRAHLTRRRKLPPTVRKHARRNMLRLWKIHVWRNIRLHRWHELKNTFNGYLAEPEPWPEGLTRCGTGWTHTRALRSLNRLMRRPGVLWHEIDTYEITRQ